MWRQVALCLAVVLAATVPNELAICRAVAAPPLGDVLLAEHVAISDFAVERDRNLALADTNGSLMSERNIIADKVVHFYAVNIADNPICKRVVLWNDYITNDWDEACVVWFNSSCGVIYRRRYPCDYCRSFSVIDENELYAVDAVTVIIVRWPDSFKAYRHVRWQRDKATIVKLLNRKNVARNVGAPYLDKNIRAFEGRQRISGLLRGVRSAHCGAISLNDKAELDYRDGSENCCKDRQSGRECRDRVFRRSLPEGYFWFLGVLFVAAFLATLGICGLMIVF